MANFNKVLLMGNLTRDPESRTLPSGLTVSNFGLAVNDRYKDKNSGEWVEKPNFVDCEAFGRSAELIQQYLAKGRPVFIEGKLRFDQWEDRNTGQKRSRLKVVVDTFQFLGGRGEDGGQGGGGGGGGAYGGSRSTAGASAASSDNDYSSPPAAAAGPAHEPIDEDDIPF